MRSDTSAGPAGAAGAGTGPDHRPADGPTYWGPTPSGNPSQSAAPAAVPLPPWFVEIDTAKKGEVSRADFVKYRMKSFDDLDANKDGKVSLEEFLKLAEPPISQDVPGGPSLEERRNRIRVCLPESRPQRQRLHRARRARRRRSRASSISTTLTATTRSPSRRSALIMQRPAQRQAADRQQVGGGAPQGADDAERPYRHADARCRQARQEQRRQDQPAGISRGRRPWPTARRPHRSSCPTRSARSSS